MSGRVSLKALKLAGAVWSDYLDPDATGMQKELGLGSPTFTRRGRGYTAVWYDVPVEVACELADYLADRAGLLLNQDDDGQRSAHYAALKAADRIRREVRDAELLEKALRFR